MSHYRSTNFSNPITKAGRVVYNVSLDMNHAKYRMEPAQGNMLACPNCRQDSDPETITVQPHELLLEQDRQLFKRSMSRSVNDTEVLVLSALNGLKINSKNHHHGDPEKTRRSVRNTLKFGGVASTMARYDPDHRTQNDQVFVSQFGGLCTIQNTGDDAIKAGDFVVWDLPKHPDEGTTMCGKKQKQMVITRPYHPKADVMHVLHRRLGDVQDPLKQAVDTLIAGGAALQATQFADVLHELGDVLQDERSRVIGRAMSNADKAGDTFDLLLGRYTA